MPRGSQDRDLLWILGGGADEPLAPNLEDLPAITMEHTSPTASSEPSPMEATSLSSTDDGNPMAERQEDTSASDSVDAEQPQPNSRPSSPPAATILEAPMESTSSSSDIPFLSADDDSATAAPSPKRRHQYTRRRPRRGWAPTVTVRGVLTRKSLSICRKAAAFRIGVRRERVQRVLRGMSAGKG